MSLYLERERAKLLKLILFDLAVLGKDLFECISSLKHANMIIAFYKNRTRRVSAPSISQATVLTKQEFERMKVSRRCYFVGFLIILSFMIAKV